MRPSASAILSNWLQFQSTHPLRDATQSYLAVHQGLLHFNPRTPYGMRHIQLQQQAVLIDISIHAPLTGCDTDLVRYQYHLPYFNPRTPYGMRPMSLFLYWFQWYFNPRTPYGMRQKRLEVFSMGRIISIHAPLTGCDLLYLSESWALQISIHAPLTGCDPSAIAIHNSINEFQSTHPLRDATYRDS